MEFEAFSIDFGDRILEVYRARDDEGHVPNTAFLIYVQDRKEPKEVAFPLSWNDFHDPDLEIMVVDDNHFRLWWQVVSTGRILQ